MAQHQLSDGLRIPMAMAFVDVEMPFPGLCASKGLWAFFATLPEHIARTTNEVAMLASEYNRIPSHTYDEYDDQHLHLHHGDSEPDGYFQEVRWVNQKDPL